MTISQQCATTAICIVAANQPPSGESQRKKQSVMAAPLRVMVAIGQLQLSIWDDERQQHTSHARQVSYLCALVLLSL